MSGDLKVSIITICYNAEGYLEGTIESILSQSYSNIEFIIVDGKSQDGTLSIVERYRDKIDILISEEDHGIFDAMNKGLEAATGDIIFFLNVKDYFFSQNTVEEFAGEFSKDLEEVIYGKVQATNLADGDIRPTKNGLVTPIESKKDFFYRGLCHQRAFTSASLFRRIGSFDEKNFPISADLYWFLQAYTKGVPFRYVDKFVALYDCQGSNHSKGYKRKRENIIISYKHSNFIEFSCYVVGSVFINIAKLLRKIKVAVLKQ